MPRMNPNGMAIIMSLLVLALSLAFTPCEIQALKLNETRTLNQVSRPFRESLAIDGPRSTRRNAGEDLTRFFGDVAAVAEDYVPLLIISQASVKCLEDGAKHPEICIACKLLRSKLADAYKRNLIMVTAICSGDPFKILSTFSEIYTGDTIDVGDFAGLSCDKMVSLGANELNSICKTYASSSSGIALADCEGLGATTITLLVTLCKKQADIAADKALGKLEVEKGKKVDTYQYIAYKASKYRPSPRSGNAAIAATCAAAPVVVGVTDIFLQSKCPSSTPPVDLYIGCTSEPKDPSNPINWMLNNPYSLDNNKYDANPRLGGLTKFIWLHAFEIERRINNNEPGPWDQVKGLKEDWKIGKKFDVIFRLGFLFNISMDDLFEGRQILLDIAVDEPDIRTKIAQLKVYKTDPTNVCDYVKTVGVDQDLVFQQIVTASKKSYNVNRTFFSNLTRTNFEVLSAQADKACSNQSGYVLWAQHSDSHSLDSVVSTSGGNVSEGSACVFPFTYNAITYFKCTTAVALVNRTDWQGMYGSLLRALAEQGYIIPSSTFGFPWCSTTSNYDVDRKWVFCDPIPNTECISYIMTSKESKATAISHGFWPTSFPVMGAAVILHFAVHVLWSR
jgi:hypothetical protein